jgi:hypothetical protein
MHRETTSAHTKGRATRLLISALVAVAVTACAGATQQARPDPTPIIQYIYVTPSPTAVGPSLAAIAAATPTSTPTATPTATAAPTAEPTPKPTAKPTPRPTPKPTPKPTKKRLYVTVRTNWADYGFAGNGISALCPDGYKLSSGGYSGYIISTDNIDYMGDLAPDDEGWTISFFDTNLDESDPVIVWAKCYKWVWVR